MLPIVAMLQASLKHECTHLLGCNAHILVSMPRADLEHFETAHISLPCHAGDLLACDDVVVLEIPWR